MSVRSNLFPIEQPAPKQRPRRAPKRHASLEYGLITNLVLQQYQHGEDIDFDLLLSIPLAERIPALTGEFGKRRMHGLLVTILREFVQAVPLPRARKLNDTRISVCACDLMVTAHEDQLSMEDLILFFERAKRGLYGPIKKVLTHSLINELLARFRADRHAAYMKIKEARESELKTLGPVARTAADPAPIQDLFD
ncbi:MAG TPA: hypothetical protein VHK69_03710, partial [Chitinophagaceae bacterium]|nr:hypothetical protein [Chitinophagaceae bacterium]